MGRWKTWAGLSLLVALSAVGLVTVIGAARNWIAPPPSAPASIAPAPPVAATAPASGATPFASEQDWIVAQILHAIAEAGAFANKRDVTAGPRVKVAMGEYIWAPEMYVDARAHLGVRSPMPPSPPSSLPNRDPDAASAEAMLASLLDLRPETLLDQNRRISAALTRDIRSAAAHEDAALLVGALVLREAAGRFDDVRAELAQMTAHLAIARALRQDNNNNNSNNNSNVDRATAALAETILLASVGRQQDAVNRLDRLQAPDQATPALNAWTRALRIRATGNWELLPEPSRAPLLARLEYARAVEVRVNSSRLLDFLDTFEPEPITDWSRIGLSWRFSVEAGHRLDNQALPAEVAEARAVWMSFNPGATITPERLLQDLNIDEITTLEQNPPTVQAIGWTMWASFLQRHLCSQLVNTWRSNNAGGGWRSNDALTNTMTGAFDKLRLFPLVLRRIAGTPGEYAQAMTAARDLTRTHPEWITPANWKLLRDKPSFDPQVQSPQPFPEDVWYTPYIPTGTAFDAANRSLQANCPRPTPFADIDRWAKLSPYDMWIVWSATWHHLVSVSDVDRMDTAFGPLLSYDLGAVTHMRDYLDAPPDRHLAFAREACSLDLEECGKFAAALVENGRDAEAAREFEFWIAKGRDQVAMSHALSWVVNYYHDTNRRDRALALARFAGGVNSQAGLVTYADLLDRRGQHADAEQVYRENLNHYDDGIALAAYLLREARRTGTKGYANEARPYVSRLFPSGLEQVTLADFHNTPPQDGVLIKHGSPRSDRLGVHTGDIFVAVDGVRVRSYPQYALVWRLSNDQQVTLTVWRDGRYQQLPLRVPQRWFGVAFDSYRLK
jgi:hypothetical protein